MIDQQQPTAAAQPLTHTEPVYTVQEIARMWKFSEDAVRDLFRDEPGIRILRAARTKRRTYSTIRIPASVAERVWRRMEHVKA